ncbi:MAG: hypothetical protein H6732_09240 [Alphaproteobacteria bacterium]|nr:hypothetical protein [Alphaproteobacteria bacterium]
MHASPARDRLRPQLRHLAIVATVGGAAVAWADPPCAGDDAPAEAPSPEEPAFAWSAHPLTVAQGEVGTLAVQLVVPEGFKVFQGDVHLQVQEPAGLVFSEPSWPEGRTVHDGTDTLSVYDAGAVAIALPVDAREADAGLRTVRLVAEVRGCAARRCHVGTHAELDVLVHVAEPAAVGPVAVEPAAVEPADEVVPASTAAAR